MKCILVEFFELNYNGSNRWMSATLIDFYVNVIAIAVSLQDDLDICCIM